jgi:hypothetical protein
MEDDTTGDVHFDLDEDGHHSICSFCGDGGDIVLCDTCPKSFHEACLATLESPPPPDDPGTQWRCPPCAGHPLPATAAYSLWALLMKRSRRARGGGTAGGEGGPSPVLLSGERVRVYEAPKARGAGVPLCLLPCANGATWVCDCAMAVRAPAVFVWRGVLGGGPPPEAAALLAGEGGAPEEVRAALAAPNAVWVRDWSVLTPAVAGGGRGSTAASSVAELLRRVGGAPLRWGAAATAAAVAAVAAATGGGGGGEEDGHRGEGGGSFATDALLAAVAAPPPASFKLQGGAPRAPLSQKRTRCATDRYVAAPIARKRRGARGGGEDGGEEGGGGGSGGEGASSVAPPLLGSPAFLATVGHDLHLFQCLACEEGGSRLILCEACPRIAHARCAPSLHGKVPAWAWLCAPCEESGRGYAVVEEADGTYWARGADGPEGSGGGGGGGKGGCAGPPTASRTRELAHDALLAGVLGSLRGEAWRRMRAEGWLAGGTVEPPAAGGLAQMAWEEGAAAGAYGGGEELRQLPAVERLCGRYGGVLGALAAAGGAALPLLRLDAPPHKPITLLSPLVVNQLSKVQREGGAAAARRRARAQDAAEAAAAAAAVATGSVKGEEEGGDEGAIEGGSGAWDLGSGGGDDERMSLLSEGLMQGGRENAGGSVVSAGLEMEEGEGAPGSPRVLSPLGDAELPAPPSPLGQSGNGGAGEVDEGEAPAPRDATVDAEASLPLPRLLPLSEDAPREAATTAVAAATALRPDESLVSGFRIERALLARSPPGDVVCQFCGLSGERSEDATTEHLGPLIACPVCGAAAHAACDPELALPWQIASRKAGAQGAPRPTEYISWLPGAGAACGACVLRVRALRALDRAAARARGAVDAMVEEGGEPATLVDSFTDFAVARVLWTALIRSTGSDGEALAFTPPPCALALPAKRSCRLSLGALLDRAATGLYGAPKRAAAAVAVGGRSGSRKRRAGVGSPHVPGTDEAMLPSTEAQPLSRRVVSSLLHPGLVSSVPPNPQLLSHDTHAHSPTSYRRSLPRTFPRCSLRLALRLAAASLRALARKRAPLFCIAAPPRRVVPRPGLPRWRRRCWTRC